MNPRLNIRLGDVKLCTSESDALAYVCSQVDILAASSGFSEKSMISDRIGVDDLKIIPLGRERDQYEHGKVKFVRETVETACSVRCGFGTNIKRVGLPVRVILQTSRKYLEEWLKSAGSDVKYKETEDKIEAARQLELAAENDSGDLLDTIHIGHDQSISTVKTRYEATHFSPTFWSIMRDTCRKEKNPQNQNFHCWQLWKGKQRLLESLSASENGIEHGDILVVHFYDSLPKEALAEEKKKEKAEKEAKERERKNLKIKMKQLAQEQLKKENQNLREEEERKKREKEIRIKKESEEKEREKERREAAANLAERREEAKRNEEIQLANFEAEAMEENKKEFVLLQSAAKTLLQELEKHVKTFFTSTSGMKTSLQKFVDDFYRSQLTNYSYTSEEDFSKAFSQVFDFIETHMKKDMEEARTLLNQLSQRIASQKKTFVLNVNDNQDGERDVYDIVREEADESTYDTYDDREAEPLPAEEKDKYFNEEIDGGNVEDEREEKFKDDNYRYDQTAGDYFTKEEFVNYYGGTAEWDAAEFVHH
eukprot:g2927.t1